MRGYLRDGGRLQDLPRTSAVKPWYDDKEFQSLLLGLAKGLSREVFEENKALAMPDFGRLRLEYMARVARN